MVALLTSYIAVCTTVLLLRLSERAANLLTCVGLGSHQHLLGVGVCMHAVSADMATAVATCFRVHHCSANKEALMEQVCIHPRLDNVS